MRILVPTARYAKDFKRIRKRGWKLEKLGAILKLLEIEERLPANARVHKLTGPWEGYWECHVGSDWLLIYKVIDKEIFLAGTGTHADLFE